MQIEIIKYLSVITYLPKDNFGKIFHYFTCFNIFVSTFYRNCKL
jgi:hypothetical protein